MTIATTRRVLVVDAVGSALLGAVALVLATPLGAALGVATLVVAVVGVVFVLYGVDNALVARRTRPAALTALDVVDLAFAAAMIAIALADPFGAQPWARWLLVVVADASLVMGALKLVGSRRLRPSAAVDVGAAARRQPLGS